MNTTSPTIRIKNLSVPNPHYNPKAARLATIFAVVMFVALRLGII